MSRWLCSAGILCLAANLLLSGCGSKVTAESTDSAGTGPVPSTVESDSDSNNFTVDRPEQFPLVAAVEHMASPELNVTGVVSPDVSRQVPVPSLAAGKIIEIDARLGDAVEKGQLLFKVQSADIAAAFADYRKAVRNEQLTKMQLDRAKILLDDGAVPKSALEVAQTNEDNAAVDVETATEHLRLLGADPDHPSGIVEVKAPVSGVITDQQVAASSGVQALTSPNPFTISDMSHVWIICDVYENNLAQVHVGEFADVRLAAYPNQVLKGQISNIMPMIDPNTRTAKVRIEVANPGLMRLGMFVNATFRGLTKEARVAVPASAILHLHDRDWVFVPIAGNKFRRTEVVSGDALPANMQEIVSGIQPGQRLVSNALLLESSMEQ